MIARASVDRLHVCARCSSQLVYPTHWIEHRGGRWLVELRCPECHLLRAGVFGPQAIDAFDHELDRGTELLERELTVLTRVNMHEYVARFLGALARGDIEPMDF